MHIVLSSPLERLAGRPKRFNDLKLGFETRINGSCPSQSYSSRAALRYSNITRKKTTLNNKVLQISPSTEKKLLFLRHRVVIAPKKSHFRVEIRRKSRRKVWISRAMTKLGLRLFRSISRNAWHFRIEKDRATACGLLPDFLVFSCVFRSELPKFCYKSTE